MLVTYACGLRKFTEWVNISHPGYPKVMARHWIKFRLPKGTGCPRDINELMAITGELSIPKSILVDESGKYTDILDAKF